MALLALVAVRDRLLAAVLAIALCHSGHNAAVAGDFVAYLFAFVGRGGALNDGMARGFADQRQQRPSAVAHETLEIVSAKQFRRNAV